MGKIGCGYGSEWHLLKHLSHHQEDLSQRTLEVTGGNSIEWLNVGLSKENAPRRDDKEFVGLEFINDAQVQEKWKSFWPQTGNAQNWDAVGRIHFADRNEWLLVEAKAHVRELKSKCGATNPVSTQKIRSALEKASEAFGNHSMHVENWRAPYYQYANRLAVLYFLMKKCTPPVNARLLFIYFCGEKRGSWECPQNEQSWLPKIEEMNVRLGVDRSCELYKRVHRLFLPVNPAGSEVRCSATAVR